MPIVSYVDLQSSFQTAADRAWYFTAYQCIYGSQAVPVRVLSALGATPRGSGTYCWTDGTSEILVRGEFLKHPGPLASKGTVSISRAHYTITSPAWSYDPHYDFSQNADHKIAHLHPNEAEKWSMDEYPQKVLTFLRSGVSETFASFLDRMKSADDDIPVPDVPVAAK